MTITIYGAGAIGGLIGAFLARAGEDVLFVDRMAEHVEAMNRQGLRITGAAEFSVLARACRPEQLRGPLGLTFLAVKSQDTQAALDVLAPLAGPDTVVLSLQNGMNPPVIAARLGAARTMAAFVNFGADWQAPGHIEHGGAGAIYVGEIDGRMTDRLARVQRLLSVLMPVEATLNIDGYLWAKQIYCSLLFAQAVTDETMAGIYGDPRWQPVLSALVREGARVASAAGVRLEPFDAYEPLAIASQDEAVARASLDAMAVRARGRVKVRSGPWRDLAVRRRPTEVDYMVGWVIGQARERGIATPLNAHLVRQVKEIEAGARQRGLANLDELERHRCAGDAVIQA